MGLFSKFKRKVQNEDDNAILNLSRTTRLKRDVAAVGNAALASSALPTHGVSLFAGVYTVPRFLWCWKKHRIVKQALEHRGLQIPDRTKRDYAIPAAVGAVSGAIGAGADSLAGFADGLVPHNADATHALPFDQWLERTGESTVEALTTHGEAVDHAGFVTNLVENNYVTAYTPDDLQEHVQNGVQHLAQTFDTILPGGAPLLSERTADVAGQTVVAVAVGETIGKGAEVATPSRRSVK
ncbi:unnamed protein product [Rhizoctonia solani]|uniref:Uncharacterized protein n=1 Tax=Rhizoctonia solani TaxID=456999 RepID=A0A8H3DF46_9AGAM|nr:unnamed protein product [Rhizoctonia solani]